MEARLGSDRAYMGSGALQAGSRRPKPHLAVCEENIGEYGLTSKQQREQAHGLG
jgi:hypothetical protein